MSDDRLRDVRLLRLPVQLHRHAQHHFDELGREFMLIALSDPETQESVPERLLALIHTLRAEYGPLITGPGDQIMQWAIAGERWRDVTYTMPHSAAKDAVALGRLMAEADEFCRTGALLTMASPPLLVAYRAWFLGQFTAQLDSEAPTPWIGPLEWNGDAVEGSSIERSH